VRVPEQARAGWSAVYDSTLHSCMHGAGCAAGARCVVGRRLARVAILSGAVVPIWGPLEAVLKRHEHTLAKSDRAMRCVRVEMAGGGTLIGLRYPEAHLGEVQARLAAAAAADAAVAAAAGAAGKQPAGQRRVEPPTAVDAKALAKALTKPRTITDFFTKPGAGGGGAAGAGAGDAGGAGGAAAAAGERASAPAAAAGAKRPAAAPAAPAAKKGGAKPAGAQRFVGPFAYAAAAANAAAAAAPRCPVCSATLGGDNAAVNAHVDACCGVIELD
jgi:hypothetical protein